MVPVVTYGWLLYGARGMHLANATMVTKENCIMGEAEKVLDCHMLKRFFLQEELLQRILMPMENIDGYLGNTMQEIFTFVSHADIPQYLVQDFRRQSFYEGL